MTNCFCLTAYEDASDSYMSRGRTEMNHEDVDLIMDALQYFGGTKSCYIHYQKCQKLLSRINEVSDSLPRSEHAQ